MPFVLVLGGLLLIITGARGTYAQFGSLVAGEFTGKPNFIYFALAIFLIGAVGYIDSLRTVSRLMLALVLIGIVIANKGFFANFTAALKKGPQAPAAVPTAQNPSGQGYTSSSPLLDLGPLGTINPQLTPGGPAASIYQFFGGKTQ